MTVQSADSLRIIVDVALFTTGDTTFITDSSYDGGLLITASYNDCATFGGLGGIWTFDATPGLTFELDLFGHSHGVGRRSSHLELDSSNSYDGQWSGALDWQNAGRSGRCDIQLRIASRSTIQNDTVRAAIVNQGLMCGVPVSDSVEVVTAVG